MLVNIRDPDRTTSMQKIKPINANLDYPSIAPD